MASKKTYKFTYRLRLFLPITALIWIIIAVMGFYTFHREQEYRRQNVLSTLALINQRIEDMIRHNYDVNRFLKFVQKYYGKNELEGIRVSIFIDGEDFPTWFIGQPIFTPFSKMNDEEKYSYYCYDGRKLEDYNIIIRSVLPLNQSQNRWQFFDNGSGFWIFVIILGLTATALSYITAAHMARNVTLMRNFIERAVKDEDFTPTDSFTNDEMGDISRRIVDIYKERQEARIAHDREHRFAVKAMEERARLRRQLTNNVNHELKTPVGIIKGYVDTMLAEPNMPDEQREHFMLKIQKQVDRLVNMLEDLSTLTRLDDASTEIPTHAVNMNELLATLDEEIYESGIGGELMFSYELPDNCVVKASDALINAAILNLVKNAANYSGGSEMGLVCTGQDDNFYSFSFYDNGHGVSQEHIPMLFARFYRIDNGRSRKKGGTGLGLSIVKSTIISMGGSINVRNRDTGGLEFLFTLPKWK